MRMLAIGSLVGSVARALITSRGQTELSLASTTASFLGGDQCKPLPVLAPDLDDIISLVIGRRSLSLEQRGLWCSGRSLATSNDHWRSVSPKVCKGYLEVQT